MVFLACGLNHKTAPLEVREKMALPAAMQDIILKNIINPDMLNEAAILSTCNRTEIYCETKDPDSIVPWLSHAYKLNPAMMSPYFYTHHDNDGLRHMLRVASGLDSMMIGEPQILGQMKHSYQHACSIGAIKNNLRYIFDYVFSASKRIRKHSGIGNNPVSIAYAAVQLIGQIFPDYSNLNVFIIGSGETSTLVTKYLAKAGVHRFMIASRNHENSSYLAHNLKALALTISDIPQYLAQADIVISATSCPLPFIGKGLVTHAMNKRTQAPMFFLDLAVPRDIEASVSDIAGVHLYNIDDLQTIITHGMQERRFAAIKAEHLIDAEIDNYIRQHRSLKAKDLICNYRNKMHKLAQKEIQRATQKLLIGKCQYSVIEELTHRLVNKFIHTPTLGLRRAAKDNREELLELVRYLLEHKDYEKIT